MSASMLLQGGVEVRLRRQTWQLLCLLAANPGRLCSKAELISALWPNCVVVEDSLVQCVGELRKALGDVDRSVVRTVARLGYRFEASMQSSRCRQSSGHAAPADASLAAAWRSLVAANNATEVDAARRQFEGCVPDSAFRAEAMAGVSMAHVIDVLNRWTRRPDWNVLLAREASEEAVALNPASALACHARAHVALIQGRHVEAYLGFRAALWRDPALVRARLRMGVIEMELGHPERTADHVRQALAVAIDDEAVQAQAFFIQGMAEFHMGRDRESSACMRRVLLLRPASGLAHQWLAAIEALGLRPAMSETHLAAFCKHVPGHTIESLRLTERSRDATFASQRGRFYTGLRLAGLS